MLADSARGSPPSSASAGDDAAHNNMPPYEVTNYIIVT